MIPVLMIALPRRKCDIRIRSVGICHLIPVRVVRIRNFLIVLLLLFLLRTGLLLGGWYSLMQFGSAPVEGMMLGAKVQHSWCRWGGLCHQHHDGASHARKFCSCMQTMERMIHAKPDEFVSTTGPLDLLILTSINALRENEGISCSDVGTYGMSRSRLDGSGGPNSVKRFIRGTSSVSDSASPSFSLLSSLGGGDGVVCNVAVLKTGLVVCEASDLELEYASSTGVPGSGSFSCTGGRRRSLLHAHAC
jgi:hypothetical protein